MLDREYVRRGVAEFVGTFALIFVGAGATIYQDVVGTALAHGLVIAVMASSVGFISGAHFNPAVTLGFLVTRRIAPTLAVWYWIVQFAAGTLAALLLNWVIPNAAPGSHNLGVPSLANGTTGGGGVVIEAVLTFFLVWVIFATAADPRGAFKQIAGLAIGFTITLDILMGAGFTGAALNPARALGPELANWHWPDAWIYYVGPCCGAVIAAALYELLYLRPLHPLAPVGTPESGVDEAAPGEAAAS